MRTWNNMLRVKEGKFRVRLLNMAQREYVMHHLSQFVSLLIKVKRIEAIILNNNFIPTILQRFDLFSFSVVVVIPFLCNATKNPVNIMNRERAGGSEIWARKLDRNEFSALFLATTVQRVTFQCVSNAHLMLFSALLFLIFIFHTKNYNILVVKQM